MAHGAVAAVAIIGLPSLIDAPVELEAPIAVVIVAPDMAVGYRAPDLTPNIWPGDTADQTGEGLAAPEGDAGDGEVLSADTAAVQQGAASKALSGEPNDLEGRDALPQGTAPGIATAAASTGPILATLASADQPPSAPLRDDLALPSPGEEIVVAQNDGGQAASFDRPATWIPPRPETLAEISDYLSQGLERLREDIENGDIPPDTRISEILAEAEQGNLESQYILAALYELGLGVAGDPAKALDWYRTAAEKRFVDAQVRLGSLLATGDASAAALIEAQSWWRLAADTGEPLAVAGAALLSDQLSPSEDAKARTQSQRIEKLWKSWEQWANADSGGGLEDRLLAAAGIGDADKIKRLIDEGANPNASNAKGKTALLLAVIAGHEEAAEALLRRGAKVNTADADGKTTLMWASDAGHKDVAELLLTRGADIEARDQYGQTALIDAAWRGRDKIVEMLLEISANANARSIEGVTALMWAAMNGYPETARKLLAAGAKVDTPDKNSYTPLIRAAWNGHTEVVAVLLEAGAAVDAKSRSGKTALRLAHSGGFKEVVALLRAAGATR
jgi:ankyrin repeat protein